MRRLGLAAGTDNWGPWYGKADVKWKGLRALAEERRIPHLDKADDDNYLRGLIEWRLATTSARDDLSRLPVDRWVEFRYEKMQQEPVQTLTTVFESVALPSVQDVVARSAQRVESRQRSLPPLSAVAEEIVGGLLDELGYRTADRP